MLYRNKKEKDINKGKWIGLGGKFESGESPEECLLREIREEAGVTLTEYRLRGIITFVTSGGECEPIYLFLYIASAFDGEIQSCDEGELKWIDDDKIQELNLWEGDRLFWKWIDEGRGFFSAGFHYDGDELVKHDVTFY